MTIHRIKLKDLNAQFLEELRAKYADQEAEIAFWLQPKRADKTKSKHLSEKQFWKLIDLLDWKKIGDSKAVVEPLVAKLSTLTIKAIQAFEDILSKKLYHLDGEKYANHTGKNAYYENPLFSVDTFLYARCCTVANGEEFYHSVLQNPTEMPKDLTFSALLRVGATAYHTKTGERFKYQPKYIYETFANSKGWPNNDLIDNIINS